jgi:hypothetical protein
MKYKLKRKEVEKIGDEVDLPNEAVILLSKTLYEGVYIYYLDPI